MVKLIKQLADKIDQRLLSPNALLLPGDSFFSQSFILPEGIGREDIRQFAELSLEGMSPFPLANLCWGYLSHPSSSHILVYAAYRERLNQLGFKDLDSYFQVFPGFITRFGETFEKPTVRFLLETGVLSALFYQPHNHVPDKIISRALGEEHPEPAALFDMCEKLIKAGEISGYITEKEVWVGIDHRIGADGSAQFLHQIDSSNADERSLTSQQYTPIALDERSIWDADVRSRSYTLQTYRARRISRRLWHGTMAATAALAVLLLTQTSIILINLWTHNRESRIEARSEDAQMVENRFDLLQKVDQFSQHGIKLFEMLDIINRLRPSSVYFTRTSSDTYNQLTVQGLGTNVEEVNRYGEQLHGLPLIADTDIQVVSRRGKAPFSLRVNFKELPATATGAVAGVPPE